MVERTPELKTKYLGIVTLAGEMWVKLEDGTKCNKLYQVEQEKCEKAMEIKQELAEKASASSSSGEEDNKPLNKSTSNESKCKTSAASSPSATVLRCVSRIRPLKAPGYKSKYKSAELVYLSSDDDDSDDERKKAGEVWGKLEDGTKCNKLYQVENEKCEKAMEIKQELAENASASSSGKEENEPLNNKSTSNESKSKTSAASSPSATVLRCVSRIRPLKKPGYKSKYKSAEFVDSSSDDDDSDDERKKAGEVWEDGTKCNKLYQVENEKCEKAMEIKQELTEKASASSSGKEENEPLNNKSKSNESKSKTSAASSPSSTVLRSVSRIRPLKKPGYKSKYKSAEFVDSSSDDDDSDDERKDDFKMATNELNRFLEDVDENVLECAICVKRLQNPKSLNCSHSFCLACLEDCIKTKGKITCPTCSKSYLIPEGWLQKLPPNTFVNNLLKTIEQFSDRDHMKCVCGKEEKAKYYCQDCGQYLCSACSDYHKILPVLANHKLHSVKDVRSMSTLQLASLSPPLCLLHSKPLEFYCVNCKIPICVNCTIIDHKEWEGKHKPVSISEAFQTFKETSAALENSAQHCKNKLQDGLKAFIENDTKLKQSKDSSLRDIDSHVKEMVKKIKKNEGKMKKKVDSVYKKKTRKNKVHIEKLRTTMCDINSKLSFLKQLMKINEVRAMQLSEMVITALKDRINKLPKTEPNDNGRICLIKQQIKQKCYIGYQVPKLKAAVKRSADCLMGEESVTKKSKQMKVE